MQEAHELARKTSGFDLVNCGRGKKRINGKRKPFHTSNFWGGGKWGERKGK